ncbi:hypothetical protein SAMN04488696_1488 [Methanolobus profundi]|uniref:Uncharacterized protein n=1 Tax=Methanolobus profundi TaxID=487685 RepID=A0A1I4RBP3_9EURY|nr:hypothetical protein SAMN04488696_1488 [Methanolobus profundi]
MYDIQVILDKNSEHNIESAQISWYIVLGNACSWSNYETACIHYDTYKEVLDSL